MRDTLLQVAVCPLKCRLLFAVLVACSQSQNVAGSSIYTRISETDCWMPAAADAGRYVARDLGVQECPGQAHYRLFVVSSDANSWLDVAHGNGVWSSEDVVVYRDAVGLFPNVSGPLVEWRMNEKSKPYALIFRVRAGDREKPEKTLSMLFVVRLLAKDACLIGRADTNEQARILADGPTRCVD